MQVVFVRPHLEKSFTKIGLVEWLKVKALSSSPTTAKKKNKQEVYKNELPSQGPKTMTSYFSCIR
jgi:hypothetical protein